VEHAERRVDPLGIPADLVAEESLGERMLRVAGTGGDAAVLDRGQNAARIRAVMGADSLVDRTRHQFSAISIQLSAQERKRVNAPAPRARIVALVFSAERLGLDPFSEADG
jgi:hypothetical protein